MNVKLNQKNNLNWPTPWNEADDEGSLTARLTQIEIAKSGFKLKDGDWRSMSRGDLMSERSNLRRITNEFSDKAAKALESGNTDESERYLRFAEETSRLAQLADRQMTLNEIADQHRRAGVDSQFRNASGKSIQVLGKTDSFADTVQYERGPDFGFGEFVAAMVRGTERADVRNALSEGTDSAGGYTVPKRLMGDLIDKLRAKTTVVQAGAITVPLDTQTTTIARIASDPAAGWRLENAAITESDPTFEAVTFTPRSLAVLVRVSRELLDDSMNIDQALTMAFAGAMAVEVDRVSLIGTGTAPEPRGIFNQTNVNSVSMGTNGAQLSNYSKILDCLYEIQLDNSADPTAMVMHPRTWRTIQGFADSTGQPLQPPPALVGLPSLVTTSVPITQTQGTGTNCSTIITGDFSQLLIGVRQELRIEVIRELFAQNHQYAFVAHLRMDVAVAHPESFCKLVGILP